jgi:protein-S-isoprenylcysteine O-methyltransferase Ste14
MWTLNLNSLFETVVLPFGDLIIWETPSPGPKLIPARYVINFCKGATLPLCLLMMYQFNNFSHSAFIITGLHGSYGLIWLLKDMVCPDPSWENPLPLFGAVIMFMVLCLYWSAAYIVIAHRVVIPPALAGLAIIIYAIGVVTMTAADAQKYFVLKLKKGLISDGWFKTCRNANYLGEIMLYSSFALCSRSYIPWAIYAFVWITFFSGRWYRKEVSFAKKEGGVEYIMNSSIIFPVPLPFLPALFSIDVVPAAAAAAGGGDGDGSRSKRRASLGKVKKG